MITEGIIYTNHLGEQFVFGNYNAWIDENSLHDYSWDYEINAKKIHSLKRTNRTYTLPCKLLARTEAEALEHKNRLTELTESDVLAEQMGKLSIGDWYIECFVTASEKSSYLYDKKYLEAKLRITTPTGGWLKRTDYDFYHSTSTEEGYDYPYDYDFDYGAVRSNILYVDRDSAFKIILYGVIQEPYVTIGTHTYAVHYPLAQGERIEIDSLNRTITHFDVYNNATNVFGYRDKNQYIFEDIPSGSHAVVWEGANQVTIITYAERSEPEWI